MTTKSDFNDTEAFKKGISEREAYIHSMYWVLLSTALTGYGKDHAGKTVGSIRDLADELYPPKKTKKP